MRCRALRIAMLCFVVLWFEILLPVHTRGQILLAGSEGASHSCCGKTSPIKTDCNSKDESRQQPSPRGRQQCAICQFIATLDIPPAVMIDVPALTPAIACAELPRWSNPSLAPRYTSPERGPPAA
jgi:hypothetical protein